MIAHEFGHALIDHAKSRTFSIEQQVPVAEHLADVHSMIALGPNEWQVSKVGGAAIRRWDDPSSVTQAGNIPARYPNTFDDYNTHGESREAYCSHVYCKHHVPSTLWSHLLYQYSQQSGVGRQNAIETFYRVAVDRLDGDQDLGFSYYQDHLQSSADAHGLGSQMVAAREALHLWPTLAETTGGNAYSRPAIVSGVDYFLAPYPPFLVYMPTLRIFANRYIGSPGGGTTDQIVEVGRDIHGVWFEAVTNVDPSTVGGALSGAFAAEHYYMAWRTPLGGINFARRWFGRGIPWSAVSAVSGVSTNADVALASNGDLLLLFYRDAQTGGLGIVRWGNGWGAPTVFSSLNLASAPTVSQDGQGFRVAWLDDDGQVRVVWLQPSGTTYSFGNESTLSRCFFNATANSHVWGVLPSVAVVQNKLYLIGAGLDGHTLMGRPRVEQAVLRRSNSSAAFAVDDGAHGQLDRVAEGIDTAVHQGRLWMVMWSNGYPAGSWSVVGKTP